MKFILITFSVLFSLSLSAQSQEETEVFTAVLQQGEVLNFDNKKIRFKEVVSDSRCPKEVTCIWAGEAKVLVEIFQQGKLIDQKIIVTNSSQIPLNFSSGDFNYFLNSLQLLPYPSAGSKSIDPAYTLKMSVSKQM